MTGYRSSSDSHPHAAPRSHQGILSMPPIPDDLRQRLHEHNQGHTLAFYDRLDERRQHALLTQLRSIDLAQLRALYALRGKGDAVPGADRICPVPVIPAVTPEDADRRRLGEEALRQGKV